ncbi:MAG: hypothetical protein OEV42_06070 [Deltaproteobacteria bacterium]|nr:hypothetical protein [Deltaproteobacteria bacterium]
MAITGLSDKSRSFLIEIIEALLHRGRSLSSTGRGRPRAINFIALK